MLQDHEFFLQCNPHMQKFENLGEVSEPALPDTVKAQGTTTLYKVTDIVETMPKGIWGSSVESSYEFTNMELGLFARIKSPLNVVMDTFWTIEPSKDGGFELVEACEIKCSRLLIGIVKSLNEGGCEFLCPSTLPLHQESDTPPSPILCQLGMASSIVRSITRKYSMLTDSSIQGPRFMLRCWID